MPKSSFYRAHGTWILLVAAALLPLIGWGAYLADRSNSNDVRDWLPEHYPETAQFQWFRHHFGNEDFILASWPGCTLDDPRLDRFAAALRPYLPGDGKPGLIRRVVTGRSLLEELTGAPLSLSRAEVVRRLRGSLVGPDGRQTSAVVTLTDRGNAHLRPTIAVIEAAAVKAGIPAGDMRLAGTPVINEAINKASQESLVRLAFLSGVIGLVIAWWCFRSWKFTAIIFAAGLYSGALSLAVVPASGVAMNAIMVTMVPLVYVSVISGAVHLTNYYLEAIHERGTAGAADRAVAHATVPLALATGTTAFGLLSLWYSDLAPIRLFGVFSAIGVVLGLAVLFLFVPAALAVWSPRTAWTRAAESDHDPGALPPFWRRLAETVIQRHRWFSIACLAVLALGGLGLFRIETSIRIMRLFSQNNAIVPALTWLEQNLGATVPVEVVVAFDDAHPQSMLQQMALVERIHERVELIPGVGGVLSAATFAPYTRSGLDDVGSLRRSVMNTLITRRQEVYLHSGYLARGGGEDLWRLSVRVRGVDDLDYSAFVEKLRAQIDPLLAASAGADRDHARAVYTGTVPIVYKARRSLLDGMIFGLGTDVALIVVGIVVATRHWASGVLLFLVSMFPTTLVFGAMGWLGIVIDIGTVMTPCVAVGVTVDDVVHFLLWFRRGTRRGMDVPQAVMLAYRGCARAMYQSWGVIGLGLSAFALSTFVPTFRFGALMLALLTVGLVGNLVFLPALLAGPLGRVMAAYFRRGWHRQATPVAVAPLAEAVEPRI